MCFGQTFGGKRKPAKRKVCPRCKKQVLSKTRLGMIEPRNYRNPEDEIWLCSGCDYWEYVS